MHVPAKETECTKKGQEEQTEMETNKNYKK